MKNHFKTLWIIGLLFFSVNFFTGCNYKINKAADPKEGAVSLSDLISFETMTSFSMRTCMNCHSGKNPPDLSTLGGLKSNIAKVQEDIQISKMPPASGGYLPLTQCQKDVLQKWVDLGMPQTSSHTVGELPSCQNSFGPPVALTPILLMPLNYETLRSRILGPKCLLCHVADAKDPDSADLPFSPYSELISKTGKKWSSPATSSKVYIEITNQTDGMPPADSDPKIEMLTDDEVTFVQRWIDAGLPEK